MADECIKMIYVRLNDLNGYSVQRALTLDSLEPPAVYNMVFDTPLCLFTLIVYLSEIH